MKAVLVGGLLGCLVWFVAARIGRWRGRGDEEPMLPEPDADWADD